MSGQQILERRARLRADMDRLDRRRDEIAKEVQSLNERLRADRERKPIKLVNFYGISTRIES